MKSESGGAVEKSVSRVNAVKGSEGLRLKSCHALLFRTVNCLLSVPP